MSMDNTKVAPTALASRIVQGSGASVSEDEFWFWLGLDLSRGNICHGTFFTELVLVKPVFYVVKINTICFIIFWDQYYFIYDNWFTIKINNTEKLKR